MQCIFWYTFAHFAPYIITRGASLTDICHIRVIICMGLISACSIAVLIANYNTYGHNTGWFFTTPTPDLEWIIPMWIGMLAKDFRVEKQSWDGVSRFNKVLILYCHHLPCIIIGTLAYRNTHFHNYTLWCLSLESSSVMVHLYRIRRWYIVKVIGASIMIFYRCALSIWMLRFANIHTSCPEDADSLDHFISYFFYGPVVLNVIWTQQLLTHLKLT